MNNDTLDYLHKQLELIDAAIAANSELRNFWLEDPVFYGTVSLYQAMILPLDNIIEFLENEKAQILESLNCNAISVVEKQGEE